MMPKPEMHTYSSSGAVVVTGASGFLGRAVVPLLAHSFAHVFAVDLVSPRYPVASNVTPLTSNLSDVAPLLAAVKSQPEPVVLVHLAWDMNRAAGYASQAENIPRLIQLLDGLSKIGLSRVVGMGSAEEYGAAEGELSEDLPFTGALSPYGWAKNSCWLFMSSWSSRQGIPLLWLRPFIIYGPDQGGTMMIPSALHAARQHVPTDFSDGFQERDFVHIDDVARAIHLASRSAVHGANAINLGFGQPVRVRHVLEQIIEYYDAAESILLDRRPRRPEEPDIQFANIVKARNLLNWVPQKSIKDGLRTLLTD